MNPEEMEKNLDEAVHTVRALSNGHRLLLLCNLGEEEKSVSTLAEELDLRQSTMSQHLARLRQDGLVETRREGQTIYYRIKDPRVKAIISTLYSQFCGTER